MRAAKYHAVLLLLLGVTSASPAQTTNPAARDGQVPREQPSTAAPGRAAGRNPPGLFKLPKLSRELQLAIYQTPNSSNTGMHMIRRRVELLAGVRVTELAPAEFATNDLSRFDVVVFGGGSGSKQADQIGGPGRAAVRKFVADGGGYLGICAGAYLACKGFDWGIGLLDARTVSPKWVRGRARLELELSDAGREVFGDVRGRFFVSYNNGPVIQPLGDESLPDYEVLAWFRTEANGKESPRGVMVDSPAVVRATFGKGRIITISPHPEGTAGLENFIPRAVAWLAGPAPQEGVGSAGRPRDHDAVAPVGKHGGTVATLESEGRDAVLLWARDQRDE